VKKKSALCSTGHGTGVVQPASLHTILERDRRRKLLKGAYRFQRRWRGKADDAIARAARVEDARLRGEQAKQARAQGRLAGLGSRFMSGLKRFLGKTS
jgi:hypothetical protein